MELDIPKEIRGSPQEQQKFLQECYLILPPKDPAPDDRFTYLGKTKELAKRFVSKSMREQYKHSSPETFISLPNMYKSIINALPVTDCFKETFDAEFVRSSMAGIDIMEQEADPHSLFQSLGLTKNGYHPEGICSKDQSTRAYFEQRLYLYVEDQKNKWPVDRKHKDAWESHLDDVSNLLSNWELQFQARYSRSIAEEIVLGSDTTGKKVSQIPKESAEQKQSRFVKLSSIRNVLFGKKL